MRIIARVLGYVLCWVAVVFLGWLLIPLRHPIIHDEYSQVVLADKGEFLRVFLNKEQQWCFSPHEGEKIPERLKKAVVCFEDGRFYGHPGVDVLALSRAVVQNVRAQHVVSGASTITMQVARMRLKQDRTVKNKLREMLLSLRLEAQYSKEEILSIYLTHAPYGGNIEGYMAASMRYFKKWPEELSWSQAATLAVLPNSPRLVSPTKNGDLLKKKRDGLLKKMRDKGMIDEETFQSALLEPVPREVFPFSTVAPHLARLIHSTTETNYVETSIDYDLQVLLERMARQYAKRIQNQGIESTSILVVENESGLVKAYIGSPDFFDANRRGQVDGIISARSSGSILKPFLYALSIDEGLISPQSVIFDIPTYYDAFSPHNANEKYMGISTARNALISSLNVPAVRLLNYYGVYSFYLFLKEAGISTLFRNSDDYGLPIVLGGAEVSPWDMAKIYRGLANYGTFGEISYLKKDSLTLSQKTSRLISRGSAILILDILRELKRPDAEYFWEQYHSRRPVAWKTGTSYGHKDAWAVGATPDYTVVVWTGNFDGHGNSALTGVTMAGPLFFDVVNVLPTKKGTKYNWFERKETDFKTVELCSETGFVAGPNCPQKNYVQLPLDMRPLKLCPFHERIEVDSLGKYEVCSLCWEKGHKGISFLEYPPAVTSQLQKRGVFIPERPPHSPYCQAKQVNREMDFIYPKDSARIWLPRDFDGSYQSMVAKVAHGQRHSKVTWFVDDVYIAVTEDEHNLSFDPELGWHVLSASDERGNHCQATFFVGKR